MKRFVLLGLLAGAICGVGCSSSYTSGRQSGLNLGMPAAGKSRVVFVRPSQFMGEGVNFSVHDGGQLIGIAAGTTYFVYDCEPGPHIFSSSMEDVAMLEANLLPDRIYYAKVSCQMGVWIARVNMYSLYPGCAGNLWQELPKILAKTRETIVKPEVVADDQRGAARYLERVNKYLPEYRANPNREQILPEHGQTQPIGAP